MAPIKAWRVLYEGEVIVPFAKTRLDAIGAAFDPSFPDRYRMTKKILYKLQDLSKETAGWDYVEHAGYRVEPIIAKKDQ